MSGRRRHTWLGGLGLGLFVALMILVRPLMAGKVDELAKLLLEDSSFKVRVQAALVLGKLGEPAGVAPLMKALGDTNSSVRAIAAQSLGRLGQVEALESLRAMISVESDSLARREADKAVASLQGQGGPGKRQKIFLTFGTFTGGIPAADAPALDILRAAMKRELTKLPSVGFSLDGVAERDFARSGRLGFLIDGKVTRLDAGTGGGTVETNCDVKVIVARWPSKSIILWTNAGAAVQGGMRPRDKDIAKQDCLEASAVQLAEDLSKFFQSQGGG